MDNLWRTGCGVGHKSVYNIILYYMLKAYGGRVLYIGGGVPKVASDVPLRTTASPVSCKPVDIVVIHACVLITI